MCDFPGCDCDGSLDRPYFPDGEARDVVVVAAILSPYPELWAQWQTKVTSPEAQVGRELNCYHSPSYLRAVVQEYEALREGAWRPDPALVARCDAIAARHPRFAAERRQALNDPWRRALTPEMLGYAPEGVAHYYDPEYLVQRVAYFKDSDDPFSGQSLRDAEWIANRRAQATKEGAAPKN